MCNDCTEQVRQQRDALKAENTHLQNSLMKTSQEVHTLKNELKQMGIGISKLSCPLCGESLDGSKYDALRSHAEKLAEAAKKASDDSAHCKNSFDCVDVRTLFIEKLDEALASYRAFTKGDGE